MADTISLDQAGDLLDKLVAEEEAKKAQEKKDKKVQEVKDALKEGAKAGVGGLNAGAARQLRILEGEGN